MTNFKCEADGAKFEISTDKDGDVKLCVEDNVPVHLSPATATIIGYALVEIAKGERNE